MAYTPSYSFGGFQANRPTTPLPGTSLDAELRNVSADLASLDTKLATVRRSDGALVNGIVTLDSMAADLKAAYTGGAIPAWAAVIPFASGIAATPLAPATVVTYNGETWLCITAHTTVNVFESAKWRKIAAKGEAGTGIGDLISTNDLSDVADPAQALDNLGGMPKAGGTFTGAVTLAGDAVSALQPTTLQQVTAALALKVTTGSLAAVATTGAYGSLSGVPALGAAAVLGTGTAAGNVVQYAATNKLPAADASNLTNLPSAPHIIVEARKLAGLDGPNATAATWNTRELSTLVRAAVSGVSLSTNRVVLPPGTYYAEWNASVFRGGANKTRLYDVTAGAVLGYGLSCHSQYANYGSNDAPGALMFTVAVETYVRLEHYTEAVATFGLASGSGTEVYASLRIWKVS